MIPIRVFIKIDEALPIPILPDESVYDLIETAVKHTLGSHQVGKPVEMTLLLSDDSRLRQLNRDYLGIDTPTDVLSFPAGDLMPGMDDHSAYLGDVSISVPTAQRQAEVRGHSLAAELVLLAIHGALHLLGYDHAEVEGKKRMWAAQADVLVQLGLHHIKPTES